MMKDIEHVALNPLDRSGVGKMIRIIHDKLVLLDSDLAILYGLETKRINEQVKRNIERFPEKFCFQLNSNEVESVKSQIATSRGTSFFARQNGGGREIHHFGVSLMDLGKKTIFCSKEDFTLEEVLKEKQKILFFLKLSQCDNHEMYICIENTLPRLFCL